MHSLLGGRTNIDPKQISIVFTPQEFIPEDPMLAALLQALWDKASQGRTDLRDYRNFRIDSIDPETLEIHMSYVPYRIKRGFQELHKIQPDATFPQDVVPRGIGVGGFLRTSNGYYIFGNKPKSGAAINTDCSTIGGIPNEADTKPLLQAEASFTSGQVLIEFLQQEIWEEMGVPHDALKEATILDIVQTGSGSIMVITDAQLRLTLAEVLALFPQREDPELVELAYFHQDDPQLYEVLRSKPEGSYFRRMAELLPHGEINENDEAQLQ